MKILLTSPGMNPGESLKTHVLRRVSTALAAFADQIGRVVVRLSDDNGPKGGVDKRCAIALRLSHVGPVAVQATSPDYYAAVDGAVRRAERAARRLRDRRGW